MFHGITGGPGIPAYYHMMVTPADRQPNTERQVKQAFTKNGTYAGRSKKPHDIIILLLRRQMSTKLTLIFPGYALRQHFDG
jgi:hypothetical protein